MEIRGYSLYDIWEEINLRFLLANPDNKWEDFSLLKGRNYSIFKSDITLRCCSLRLPENVHPLFEKERRIKLLTRKYIDETLWEEGLRGLRRATSFPKSFLFQFRLSNPKLETGKGGGCLIGLVLSWVNDEWNLHIYSRITEITINLLADMYFIRFLIKKLIEDKDLQKVKFPILNTIWNIALVNQKRDRVPLFILFSNGDESVKNFMLAPSNTRWQKVIKEHFWDIFIYPEKINWAQRKRWALKFQEVTSYDWKEIKNAHISKLKEVCNGREF